MPRIEAVLREVSSQDIHDGREKPLQNLRCWTELRDRAVVPRSGLARELPCFANWDDDGVLPNCQDGNSGY